MRLRFLLFFAFFVTLLAIGYWRLSDGFSVAKMTPSFPNERRWEANSPATPEIHWILSQSFYYIGKGSQSYVFESADKQYVLKFFRLSRYRHPSLPSLPSFLADIQNKTICEKQMRRKKLFASCILAFNELREESGLIYLHLNQTSHLQKKVKLYDNIKRPRTIEIDNYPFLIQRKGEMLYTYLGRLLKEKQTHEIKKALISLSLLLDRRVEKGIRDADPEIHKNAGFRNGKALFLDVGQFYKEEIPEDREKIIRKLLIWLGSYDEQLASDAWVILTSSHDACKSHF